MPDRALNPHAATLTLCRADPIDKLKVTCANCGGRFPKHYIDLRSGCCCECKHPFGRRVRDS